LEVWNLKRELRSLLEDLHGWQINLTNSLPHRFTWIELLSILSILFSGEKEEW
jgi:hypothetical protein